MKHILKKGIAILLTLSIAVSMCLITATATDSAETMIFLKPSSNWYQDKARFAAYFFGGGSDNIWVSMDLVEDGVYSAPIPSNAHTKVIFCRMTYKDSANNWDNRWNQTSDLIIPTDGTNCYTVSEGSWSYGSGSWSIYKYDPPVIQPDTYKVVVGDANTDNVIDVKDVTKIQRDIAFESNLSEKQTVADDITGDKAVDIKDVTALTRYLCDYDEDYGKTGFYYGETPIKGNLIKNSKFEVYGDKEKDVPFGWERDDAKNADLKLIASDRNSNATCLKMNNTSTRKNSIRTKLYGLEPGAIYKLNGYIKTENVAGGSKDNGAYIAIHKSYPIENTETNWRKGTTGWGEESVYFVANAEGYAEALCCMDNTGIGYFESLTVTKCTDYDTNPDVIKRCIKGKYVDTYVRKNTYDKFTDEEIQIWADDLDFAYEQLAELVGDVPYNGDKIIINSTSEPFVSKVIAYAGNPIKLNYYYEYEDLERVIKQGCVSFGMFHEIGHDFDYIFDWSIDGEVTTNYKMLYILDHSDRIVIAGETPTDSRGLRDHYKKTYYDTSVGVRNGKYDLFAMVYIYSRFTDVVGWDAVKATFREFGEYMPNLKTNLGKFTYFMYKVQENYNKLNPNASGTEIRDSFPAGELEYVKQLVTTVKDGGKYVASEDYFK